MKDVMGKFLLGVGFVGLIFVGIYLFPWNEIAVGSTRMINVVGSSKKMVKNQVARFSVGVSIVKDKKEDAVAEVNKKMEEIVAVAKGFGIDEADIKTQGLNIYQMQESYYEDGRTKTRQGQWNVGSSVEVMLRDVSRASELFGLFSATGATNVNGPFFSLDDEGSQDDSLMTEALQDARKKALQIAEQSGGRLGKIISVVEGDVAGGVVPMYAIGREMGGGGPVTETGSSTVYKSVTVTFELK